MASRNPNFSDDRPGPHARNQDTTWQPHQQQNIAGSSTPQSDTASLRSVRKRASFFGRSNSDASSMRRAPAISHSTKASFSARVDDIASRPGTSASAESRRRKTEPLQSIRDSIFGGKKKAAAARERAESVTSRPSSRGAQVVLGATAPRPNQFRSEEDCESSNIESVTAQS